LGYVREGNQLIAIGAVKNPAESYVHKVSRSAKFDLNGYGAELGWIYVAPEARGRQLATSISHALCNSHKGSIFATTRCDNAGMQAILRKLDFKKVGLDYDSVEHPGKQIELWVRQR
jgi:RimJ/RimL family protein N-acetyltransferase